MGIENRLEQVLERSSDTLSDGKTIAFQGEETGEYAALDNIPAFRRWR